MSLLYRVSSGVSQKLTDDCFWLDSQVGFPLTLPVFYYQDDGVTPLDLTSYTIALQIFTGRINEFAGSPLLEFDQTVQAHGTIEKDNSGGIATLSFTAAGSAALAAGSYSYRWLRKVAGVFESRTFYGRWRHRA